MLSFNVLNRFSGEVQFTAEIDCSEDASTSIKLGLAVKWAIKSRADLSGADLSGADLNGDKLVKWLASARRSDGYEFIGLLTETGPKIRAGCRWFSDEEYRAHIASEYPDTAKATETLAILDFLKLRAEQVAASEQKDAA